LICDGQKNPIIHGNRASEKSSGICAYDGNVFGIAAQCRTSRLRSDSGSIIRLKRNPCGLRRAVCRSHTRISDEHLAVAAIGAARGNLGLHWSLTRRMARSDGQKRDETSRSANRRQNALRSDQCSVRIRRNQMRRRCAGISRPGTSIEQIDLAPRRRIFHQIRGRRAESHIASVGAHRGRVTIVVRSSTVSRCGKKSRVRLASSRGSFAGIA